VDKAQTREWWQMSTDSEGMIIMEPLTSWHKLILDSKSK
jgi:hypothetical protein